MNRGQTAGFPVEGGDLRTIGRTGQLAVQSVRPGVIRTTELLGIPFALHHLNPAMLTHIGKGVQPAVLILTDNNGLAGNPQGAVVARLGVLLDPADAQPVFHENLVDLFLENLG